MLWERYMVLQVQKKKRAFHLPYSIKILTTTFSYSSNLYSPVMAEWPFKQNPLLKTLHKVQYSPQAIQMPYKDKVDNKWVKLVWCKTTENNGNYQKEGSYLQALANYHHVGTWNQCCYNVQFFKRWPRTLLGSCEMYQYLNVGKSCKILQKKKKKKAKQKTALGNVCELYLQKWTWC